MIFMLLQTATHTSEVISKSKKRKMLLKSNSHIDLSIASSTWKRFLSTCKSTNEDKTSRFGGLDMPFHHVNWHIIEKAETSPSLHICASLGKSRKMTDFAILENIYKVKWGSQANPKIPLYFSIKGGGNFTFSVSLPEILNLFSVHQR